MTRNMARCWRGTEVTQVDGGIRTVKQDPAWGGDVVLRPGERPHAKRLRYCRYCAITEYADSRHCVVTQMAATDELPLRPQTVKQGHTQGSTAQLTDVE